MEDKQAKYCVRVCVEDEQNSVCSAPMERESEFIAMHNDKTLFWGVYKVCADGCDHWVSDYKRRENAIAKCAELNGQSYMEKESNMTPHFKRDRMEAKVKLLTSTAKLPAQCNDSAVGYDLYADIKEPIHVRPGEYVKISTGVAIETPEGFEAQVRGRSGLASKGIYAHFGTIDPDYRGDVAVVLFNVGGSSYAVGPGDRVAQLCFARVPKSKLVQVHELSTTGRGGAGFGSSGV